MSLSKLEHYLQRVSQEDAGQEQEEPLVEAEALEPAEVEANAIIEEQEVEVPEPVAEVTDAEVEVAQEEATEADEELAEVAGEAEELADTEGTVQDEIVAIEEFTQVLAHGLKTKTFSPQFAAVAQMRLERLASAFGDEKAGVSLENYNSGDLEQFYIDSMESFNGFLKRLVDVLDNGVRSLAEKLSKKMTVSNYNKKAQALFLRADAVLSGSAKEEPVVVKGKGVAADFHFGGEFDGNVLASMTRDLRFLSGPGAALIKNCDTFMSKLMDIIDTAVKDGGVGKTGDLVAKALELKRPVDQLPEDAFDAAMAGGLKFKRVATKAKGDDDRRGNYKDIGRAAIPGIDGTLFKGEAADVTIDKATADKLAKAAKAQLAMALKVVEKNGFKSLETFYRRIDVTKRAASGANATSWGENKDLNILASKLIDMGHQQFHVYYVMLDTAFDNAQNAIELAEKAVKKTPSNEDFNLTVSQEGWLGALAGFIGTGVVSTLVPFAGGGVIGASAKAQLQKLQEDIAEISERIAKVRNGMIDDSVKKGLELPKSIKKVDAIDIAKGAVWGTLFGPIYGAVKGSEIENEYNKLNAKLAELEKVLKQADVQQSDK